MVLSGNQALQPSIQYSLEPPGCHIRSLAILNAPQWQRIPHITGLGNQSEKTKVHFFAQRPQLAVDHYIGSAPIDMLPEEVLLETFSFYLCGADGKEGWKTLVHVCRRWRSTVFSAPRRLDLRLVCTDRRSARSVLGIWPELPIVIRTDWTYENDKVEVLAALEHNDRICEIRADRISDRGFELLAQATQAPLPALTDLHLQAFWTRHVPDSFLRGSAPHLRSLHVEGFEFPALPKLLLSATGLVDLSLRDFPFNNTWMMVDCLPSWTRLERLLIHYPYSRPLHGQASGPPPPLTRIVLPVLTEIDFYGGSKSLDHFFSHLDAPVLKHVDLRFSDMAVFDFSQISQFIGRKESFELFDQAHMWQHPEVINIALSSKKGTTGGMWLKLKMKCKHRVWQLQTLTLNPHPPVDPLVTDDGFDIPFHAPKDIAHWWTQTGNAQWLEYLRFFSAVENLYLSEAVAWSVTPVLGEISAGGSAVTARGVLPALQTAFIENYDRAAYKRVREAMGKFIAERELSGHPVVVCTWNKGRIKKY